MLRSIIKLTQANVTFSSFESIIVRWFDFVTPPGIPLKVCGFFLDLPNLRLCQALTFRSLPRLFNREADSSRRMSTINDGTLIPPETVHTDPWKVFIDVASEGIDGLERSILWLRVMARSAVEIPVQTLKQLFTLAQDFRTPLAATVSLLESTMTSMWLKTFGDEGLDSVMVEINVIWADDLLFRMQSEDDIEAM